MRRLMADQRRRVTCSELKGEREGETEREKGERAGFIVRKKGSSFDNTVEEETERARERRGER